jgi:hypothetical protein
MVSPLFHKIPQEQDKFCNAWQVLFFLTVGVANHVFPREPAWKKTLFFIEDLHGQTLFSPEAFTWQTLFSPEAFTWQTQFYDTGKPYFPRHAPGKIYFP